MFLEKMFLVDEKFQFMCIEYADVLVSTWYGKSYELMFADVLNVSWSGEDYLNSMYLDEKDWNREANLERYHGVYSKWLDCEQLGSSIIEIICREVERGNPIGLIIDISKIAFFQGEGEEPLFDIALVVGIDIERGIIYYRVMHNRDRYTDILHMTFDQASKSTVKCRLYENRISEEGNSEQISLILSKVIHGNWGLTISMLKSYSDYFIDNLNYQKVIGEYTDENIRDVPLIFNMVVLYRSRAFFSFVLSYIGKKMNNKGMLVLADQLMICAGKFYNIRGILLKSYFLGNMSESYKQKIKEIFLKIVEIEQHVLECLRDNNTYTTVTSKNNNYDVVTLNNRRYDTLKLDIYFNNKAFAMDLQNSNSANFDGIGSFFINREYPYGQSLSLDDRYIFSIAKKENEFDNISCCRQEIEVESKFYCYISIMASASHGNFKDYMIVVYESGKQEQILISCSCCWHPKAHFEEKIIWQGEYVTVVDRDQYYKEKRKLNIYAQSYAVDDSEKIKKIILPNCPDMHIFAITLYCACRHILD